MATATIQALEVPLQIYDASTGMSRRTLYFDATKSATGTWQERMLDAQRQGKRLASSAEWYRVRQWLQQNKGWAELDFITGPSEWTGTVLDYGREAMLEGIVLNPDGTIASARNLGSREGFYLPPQSSYVKDLPDRHMKVVQQVWSLKNPKRELPDYAYLWVIPGFMPVVRGFYDDRRFGAYAGYGPADRSFAARYVSETRPSIIEQPAMNQ